jgi:hypothetical protein
MVGFVLLLGTGCGRPPPFQRSDVLERSQALLAKASVLEADLHAQAVETVVFSELNERRQQATEVTCNVTQTHVREIQRLADLQVKKRLARRLAMLGNTVKNPARRESPWR